MSDQKLDDQGVTELSGRVLMATIIAVFILLVLLFLLHIYARWLWHRRQQQIDTHNNHRSGPTRLRHGLDAAFLKTIPVIQFEAKDFKDGFECSVCLSELEEGEKARILPKCNHAFHVECIDMWFHSHSTCPVCRNPVKEQTQVSVESSLESHQTQEESTNRDSHTLPTNVLFRGDEMEESNQHQVLVLPLESPSSSSSSSSQINNDRRKPDLVIDIPRQVVVGEGEDEKTPVVSGMRSLRRILSGSTRRFNPFSPSGNNNGEGGQS